MKKIVKKIIYLLIYLLTFTPCFFYGWFLLWCEETFGGINYGPKLYCSYALYGMLLISIISIIFPDGWKRRKSSLIVFALSFDDGSS